MLKCGQEFWLEKFVKGKWKKLPENKNNNSEFESVAYLVKPKKEMVMIYKISKDIEDDIYLRSQLTKGTYRIHVNADFASNDYNYVIFKIK